MAGMSNFSQPCLPKFDGDYDHWSMLMENLLRSKEYWTIIETGIPEYDAKEKLTDAQKMPLDEQKLKDLKAKNYLFQSIDKSILKTITHKETTKQLWDSMKIKYQGNARVKRAQLQTLRRNFEILEMKIGESVTDYFARVMLVANDMRNLGKDMQDVKIVEKLLRTLTEKFNYIVCSIEESKDIDHLSMDELQSSLLVHEQKFRKSGGEEQALKITYEGRMRETDRGRDRGISRGRGMGRGRGRIFNKALIECFNYHKLGHFQYECPSWEKTANYAENCEEDELLLMAYVEHNNSNREGKWFLDSGCSNHMTGNKQWFVEINEEYKHSVKLGNNMRMAVTGKGSIKLQIGETKQVIADVYYIPELRNNLLSMGQLQEEGLTILIRDGACNIYHKDRGLFMQTYMTSNRVFVLSSALTYQLSTCFKATTEDITTLWHQSGDDVLSSEPSNGSSFISAESVEYGQRVSTEDTRAERRNRRTPVWMQDYESGEGLSDEENLQNVALFIDNEDPINYEDAASSDKWRKAIDLEIESIHKNGTWELVDLPTGAKKIGVKWVYKTKFNEKGEIDKHKGHLVAKGYNQEYGINYYVIFAPVACWDTIRMVLALAAQNGWTVFQLDVKSAFLHGDLEEPIYVDQPMGYVKKGEESKVYKLLKALYGLKQTSRA
ncbi:hypothetical protein AgCh_037437 [Apium graveolens]